MSDYPKPQWQAYLDRATQDRIGRELRVIFAEPFQQPLPDTLLGALRAIQDAEKGVNRECAAAPKLAALPRGSVTQETRPLSTQASAAPRGAEAEGVSPIFA